MSVPRRFNKPQNLSRLDVLIEDTAVISKYFNITEFPEVLTQGKSSFLIGGSALLKPLTEVKFEIVNDEGNTIEVRGDHVLKTETGRLTTLYHYMNNSNNHSHKTANAKQTEEVKNV